jgi:Holliday junction resolvase RusA-like endonuclease
MDRITIELPMPPKQLHPNARSHWRAKLKPKAQQRQQAYLAALDALRGAVSPRWESAKIHATYWLGSRGKKHDADNLIAWLKATVDGLQDAGILADDSGLTWLPPDQIYGKGTGTERTVVLVLEPLTRGA